MRQFEFIQARWCNDGDAFGLARDKDFLLSPGDPEGKMTINGHPPRFLHPQPALVTTARRRLLLRAGPHGLALLCGIA